MLRAVNENEQEVSGVLLNGTPLNAYATHGFEGLRTLRDSGRVARKGPQTAVCSLGAFLCGVCAQR